MDTIFCVPVAATVRVLAVVQEAAEPLSLYSRYCSSKAVTPTATPKYLGQSEGREKHGASHTHAHMHQRIVGQLSLTCHVELVVPTAP